MDAERDLDARLDAELGRLAAQGLLRELPDPLESGADFTSNDYLGFARRPELVAAARAALEAHGAGGRASRLLGGGSPLDRAAERALAAWLGSEDALLFSSGWHANVGLVGALVGPGDVVFSDELNHASLVDAIRLARARAVVYRHADAGDLERRLSLPRGAGRALVVTESVFSMDGDLAPLEALAAACARHGALLAVDEAHAAGLIGPAGAGGWAGLGAQRARDPLLAARVVTGGKALGAAGGFVACSARVRDLLVQRARTLSFTTALPPAVSGALAAAIPLAREAQAERSRALALARRAAAALQLATPRSAIVPLVVGDAQPAMDAAARLRAAGLLVRAVRPPTVPAGTARLRLCFHATNTDAEVERLVEALAPLARAARGPQPQARGARALAVCGTGTDVGKTVVAALLLRAAARRGTAAYWKPVQSGSDDDTRTVERLTEIRARFEPAQRFRLPASPHEAAAAEGARVDPAQVDAQLEAQQAELGSGVLLVELAGGLAVPWDGAWTQLDWLARRRPALVLVADSGLGTLNHTLLSLEALRARALEPRALFLVGAPHPSNRETLERLGRVARTFELPRLAPLEARALDAWIDAHDLDGVWPEAS